MKSVLDCAEHLEFIDFDGDENGGMTILGWPRLRASYKSSGDINDHATDHKAFCDLDLYTPDGSWSMWESGLQYFEWRDGSYGEAQLTLTFELRGSKNLLQLTYGNPQLHAGTGLTTEFQSLYLQALGRSNGRYRHEFIFQNGCVIVSGDKFDCSQTFHANAILGAN